jgi:hypothetical protein
MHKLDLVSNPFPNSLLRSGAFIRFLQVSGSEKVFYFPETNHHTQSRTATSIVQGRRRGRKDRSHNLQHVDPPAWHRNPTHNTGCVFVCLSARFQYSSGTQFSTNQKQQQESSNTMSFLTITIYPYM